MFSLRLPIFVVIQACMRTWHQKYAAAVTHFASNRSPVCLQKQFWDAKPSGWEEIDRIAVNDIATKCDDLYWCRLNMLCICKIPLSYQKEKVPRSISWELQAWMWKKKRCFLLTVGNSRLYQCKLIRQYRNFKIGSARHLYQPVTTVFRFI